MENLAYLQLALIKEMPPQVSDGELDRRSFSDYALLYFLPVMIIFGVFGMAMPTLAQTFEQGATGSEITLIQERLQQLGYFNQSPTGLFGSATRDAVIRFQQDNGLTPDGVVGSQTLSLLNARRLGQVQRYDLPPRRSGRVTSYGVPSFRDSQQFSPTSTRNRAVLQRGDRGAEVTRLQEKLYDRGFDPGSIDGVYGGQTESAVRQFQSANNLFADGRAGRSTLTALGIRSDSDFNPEQASPYVVVVPFQNERTLEQVRAIVGFGNASLGEAKQGRYVNAGAFESRARAESRSSLLRSRGIDARVQYFR